MRITIRKILPPLEKKAKAIYFARIALSILVILVASLLDLRLVETIILSAFMLSLVYRVNSNYAFSVGILFIIATPMLMEINLPDMADKSVVYAYYFMAMGVLSALFEKKTARPIRKNSSNRRKGSIHGEYIPQGFDPGSRAVRSKTSVPANDSVLELSGSNITTKKYTGESRPNVRRSNNKLIQG